MNTEKIIEAIIKKFKDLSKDQYHTNDILSALCNVGKKEFKYSVFASSKFVNDCEKTGGEWLYDVTWYEPDNEGYMKSIPVAAECEWGTKGAISDDFQKLLCSRASVRVFIYDEKRFEMDPAQEKFSEWITNYNDSQNGDTYLFVGRIKNGEEQQLKYFKIVVNKINQTEFADLSKTH